MIPEARTKAPFLMRSSSESLGMAPIAAKRSRVPTMPPILAHGRTRFMPSACRAAAPGRGCQRRSGGGLRRIAKNGYVRLAREEWIRAVEKRRAALGR
jgi:hypothetical protein